MIVITTSGIKIKASERIMSPAVACRVVRATSYLHRARQLGSPAAGADRVTRARRSSLRSAPTDARRALRSRPSWTLFLMESIETIARHDGPRGEVVLRRRLGPGLSVEELIINGAFAMDSSDSSTESLLGELAVPSGRARRVLVGGLGLGYTVAAISAKTSI